MDFILYLLAVFVVTPLCGGLAGYVKQYNERQQEKDRNNEDAPKHNFLY